MIIDSRSLPEGELIDADICIAGGGVAGITLGLALKNQNTKVCILESGGLEPDDTTQSLAGGENVGIEYGPLEESRLRRVGGTSHTWRADLPDGSKGARMRPLDAIDFEEREDIPYSGWPFGKTHLDPYYARANQISGLETYDYSGSGWETRKTPAFKFTEESIRSEIFQFARRELFTKDYIEHLRHVNNVLLFTYANVTAIKTNPDGSTVEQLEARCLDGKCIAFRARHFVLATGGIENARLLLLNNRVHRNGLGNTNDLVGRFFMEHPNIWSGSIVPLNHSIMRSSGFYKMHVHKDTIIKGLLAISDHLIRERHLLNYSVTLYPTVTVAKGEKSFRKLRKSLSSGKIPDDIVGHMTNVLQSTPQLAMAGYRKIRTKLQPGYPINNHENMVFRMNHVVEQTPNRESRITLGESLDILGQRTPILDWQLIDRDITSIIEIQDIIDQAFQKAGIGSVQKEMKADDPLPLVDGKGHHHMGTTRMHRDPKIGVVDENCRVHGVANLFIAGSSVFPTGGYANPTLTIVALTVRLADHLKSLRA